VEKKEDGPETKTDRKNEGKRYKNISGGRGTVKQKQFELASPKKTVGRIWGLLTVRREVETAKKGISKGGGGSKETGNGKTFSFI